MVTKCRIQVLFSFSSDKDRRTDSRMRRENTCSAAPPGIEPRVLRILVARSNHWATKPQRELRVHAPRVPTGHRGDLTKVGSQIYPKTPPRGRERPCVLPLGPLNQVGEHTQITVQTDDGQKDAPLPEPTSWSNSPPRVKRSGQIPMVSRGGGGHTPGPGACNWWVHKICWKECF